MFLFCSRESSGKLFPKLDRKFPKEARFTQKLNIAVKALANKTGTDEYVPP